MRDDVGSMISLFRPGSGLDAALGGAEDSEEFYQKHMNSYK